MNMLQIDSHCTTSGCLALPAVGEGSGVLVLHAWWGLTGIFKNVCERLAEAGFVAYAPDLYHGQTAATIEEATQVRSTLNFDGAVLDIIAAITFLRSHPQVRGLSIGAIGFSMGAAFALGMSTSWQDIGAVVAFYGLELGPDYTSANAAYLGHFAELDEWESAQDIVTMEQVLRKAGKEVTFYTYPSTRHWFFEENRPGYYDAGAANLAWQRTLAFLRSHLAHD
ncbi:MAG: dienelactone hydrolase family protein [Ktedonobacteraceae bacterium]